MPIEKQKIPRHKEKYPALNFKRQVKLRYELLEDIAEYVDQLSESEKEWLNRFLEETVITNFKHKGKLLYKSKKDKRALYGENNARNRCLYTKLKAMKSLTYLGEKYFPEASEGHTQNTTSNNDVEDAMLTLITLKQEGYIPDLEANVEDVDNLKLGKKK